MRIVFVIFVISVIHFGLVALAWAGAGMTGSHGWWRSSALVLGFPLSVLPMGHAPEGGPVSWALQSLVWGCGIVGIASACTAAWGAARQAHLIWLLPMLLVAAIAIVHIVRTPAPFASWRTVWIDDVAMMLPWVFERSTAEVQHAEAIAEQLGRTTDATPTEQRWYWNYRPTVSGAPEYDGVAIAMPASADAASFVQAITAQRAPLWTQARWDPVTRGAGYVIETSLPNPAPLPQHERNRLLRIRGEAPARGFWFGMVVLARKAGPDELVLAWQRATAGPVHASTSDGQALPTASGNTPAPPIDEPTRSSE